MRGDDELRALGCAGPPEVLQQGPLETRVEVEFRLVDQRRGARGRRRRVGGEEALHLPLQVGQEQRHDRLLPRAEVVDVDQVESLAIAAFEQAADVLLVRPIDAREGEMRQQVLRDLA